MKAVILAGGFGTRIGEETHLKPKPMIEIGDKPIIWHIMKTYSAHGVNDFIICLGYKGYMIKEYFANYTLHMSDITFDLAKNKIRIHHQNVEPWRVTLVDTGEGTMTGGRIKRIRPYVENEPFLLTYGDGVADIDLQSLIHFHKKHGKFATLTAVSPPGRFGAIRIGGDNKVESFLEKPIGDGGAINGGFFVLEPPIFEYIEGETTYWEKEPLETLARDGQLMAYRHTGFWHAMDTMRDRKLLDELWGSGHAPWKIWE